MQQRSHFIGFLLLREGFITRRQLYLGLRDHRKNGARLGQIMIEAGWLNAQDLLRCLGLQLELETLLHGYHGQICVEIFNQLEPEIWRTHGVLPVSQDVGGITFVVTGPQGKSFLETTDQFSGREFFTYLVGDTCFESLLEMGEDVGDVGDVGGPGETFDFFDALAILPEVEDWGHLWELLGGLVTDFSDQSWFFWGGEGGVMEMASEFSQSPGPDNSFSVDSSELEVVEGEIQGIERPRWLGEPTENEAYLYWKARLEVLDGSFLMIIGAVALELSIPDDLVEVQEALKESLKVIRRLKK
ncbi:MAG: hypothetical protein VYA34_03880 [Myxococcota bacterium]|nr:hypothetical protein [Myxococcota bacterium]